MLFVEIMELLVVCMKEISSSLKREVSTKGFGAMQHLHFCWTSLKRDIRNLVGTWKAMKKQNWKAFAAFMSIHFPKLMCNISRASVKTNSTKWKTSTMSTRRRLSSQELHLQIGLMCWYYSNRWIVPQWWYWSLSLHYWEIFWCCESCESCDEVTKLKAFLRLRRFLTFSLMQTFAFGDGVVFFKF